MKRKKIISSLLVLTMMISLLSIRMISATEPGDANPVTISLTPDKTEAIPSDVITYTLKLGPVENVGGMHFVFDIPNGLTFVEDSDTLANNLKRTLGADNVEFVNDEEKYFIAIISDGYTSASDTTLMTFQCSVDDDASGTLQIGINDGGQQDLFYDTSLNDIVNNVSSPGVHVTRPCTHENKTEVPATDATCTQPGNRKYYTCDDCDKILKADGVTETTVADETIAALGHSYGAYQYDDNEHWKECSRCHELTTKESHTPGEAVRENEVEATCTENGSYEEVVYCSKCHKEISRTQKTIEASGHTPGEPVIENEVAATCTEAGSYDEVVYCSVCGQEISRTPGTTPALGHDYQESVKQEGDADHLGIKEEKCSRCGEQKPGSEKYYVKEGTAPSQYPDGTAISGGDTEQSSAKPTLKGQRLEMILEDPLGILGEGFTIEVESITDDLGADYDGNYEVENAYKADVVLKNANGAQISGELGGKVRLLFEIPDYMWDTDLEVLRINPGEDTEYEETVEYHLYDSDGHFIKVVDKDYQPEAGQTVKKFLAIWTDHFSEYAPINPKNATSGIQEGNITGSDIEGNGSNVGNRAESAISSALKTGQNLMEAYFIVTALSLSVIAIYLALKKKKMFENK